RAEGGLRPVLAPARPASHPAPPDRHRRRHVPLHRPWARLVAQARSGRQGPRPCAAGRLPRSVARGHCQPVAARAHRAAAPTPASRRDSVRPHNGTDRPHVGSDYGPWFRTVVEQICCGGCMTQRAAPARATWRDYFVLTKPKVIVLLLMSPVADMFIAAGGFPGWIALFGVIIGGYMSAGAAGVYNMIYD